MRSSNLVLATMTSLLVACGGAAFDATDEDGVAAPELVFVQQSQSRTIGRDEPPDATMLAGGYVVLRAEHPDLRTAYAAQSTDEAVISVDVVSTDCLCRAETNARQVAPEERCAAGETRSCIVIIGGRPLAAGDASIDLTDDRGTFVQRLPVHVGAAAAIEATVHSGEVPRGTALVPADDGVFEVRVGELVSVAPLLRDASGRELHFTGTEDVTLEAARDGVLSEGEPLSAGYSGRAERVGTSFVTISVAGGVEQAVPFRVIP